MKRAWKIGIRTLVRKLKVADKSPELPLASPRLFNILKMGQYRPLFRLFSVFFKQIIHFFTTNQCEKCHVHPVYDAGIRTHDLRNLSFLPQPLDQGSSPNILTSNHLSVRFTWHFSLLAFAPFN